MTPRETPREMQWDPTQYLKFADHRLQPALDLLARVPLRAPARVVDLGCGAGNVTRLLAERWPEAEVIGVDGSAEMLDRAAGEAPAIAWRQADIAAWQPETPPDLLYSNAALHWLEGHEALFPRLFALLPPGGVLAVQMPRNFAEPSHQAIAATIAEGPWRERLQPLWRPEPVLGPEVYYRLLSPAAASLEIWETVYWQVLEGENPVAEYTKGTWLRSFLAALPPEEALAFEADYRARVAAAYPQQAGGRTLFPFRRLFLLARRG